MISLLKQHVIERITFLITKAQPKTSYQIIFPKIKYVSRGMYAGKADPRTNTVTFNSVLMNDNPHTFVAMTVAHELAHLITNQAYGVQEFDHGPKWRKLMELFEADPRVTHQYDVSKLINVKRQWACACQTHYVSSHVARQLRAGAQYICHLCNTVVAQKEPSQEG